LAGGAAGVGVEAGAGLLATTPARPVSAGPAGGRRGDPQAGEQAADRGHRQGEGARRDARNRARLRLGRSPFCAAAGGSTPWARATAREARARQARVRWRGQPGQRRASYWARPTSCLAARSKPPRRVAQPAARVARGRPPCLRPRKARADLGHQGRTVLRPRGNRRHSYLHALAEVAILTTPVVLASRMSDNLYLAYRVHCRSNEKHNRCVLDRHWLAAA